MGDDWDSDRYLDNVVLPAADGTAGPARTWQRRWEQVWDGLRGGSVAVDLALGQGFVLTHDQARAAGLTRADLRRLVRRREWSTPRHGVLCVLPPGGTSGPWWDRDPDGASPEIAASALALVTRSVISNESAAAALGLPLLRPPARPAVTDVMRRGCGGDGRIVRAATLSSVDITQWFGAPITTVARTVVDLARHRLRDGLVAADAALNEKLCTRSELAAVLSRAPRWPGVRGARRAVALACAESESAAESLARLLIDDHGLPLPTPQVLIRTPLGIDRVDGLWISRAVVLEVDGLLKYERSGALAREKKRQERLERIGYRVIRVTWDDLMNEPGETAARITRALRAGGRPHLRGVDPRITRDLWA